MRSGSSMAHLTAARQLRRQRSWPGVVVRQLRPLTWISWLILTAALLWPGRLSGPFDGAPLDGVAEAVVVGVLFPALWWFHPRFLTTRFARTCVVALLAWKAFTAVT